MIPTFHPRNSCIAICLFVSARTFRPWTHTSDDSYIYQLSLVVATATVFFCAVLVSIRHSAFFFLSFFESVLVFSFTLLLWYYSHPVRRRFIFPFPLKSCHYIVRAKRVSNCYWYIQKIYICGCVRLILVLVWSANRIRPKHGIPLPV